MSSSHHDDSHSNEVKPVSFTVPFILAAVLLFIIIMFLSLCDPKGGHHAEHHDAAATSHEATTHDAKKEATAEKSESTESYEGATPVDTAVKEAPAHH